MDEKIKNKVETFFSQFPIRTCRKGEIILHPEEQAAGAYYIRRGFIRTYGISVEGVEMTIHIFTARSFFPMTSVIADIQNRYYYEALTDTEVCSIPKEALISFLKENPDVLYNLTTRLLHGLDKLTLRMELLVYGKASARVISALQFLARHFGDREGKKVTIREKFTHREIAAFAGITRETASREWEKLNQKGIITNNKQYIVIPDIDNLQLK